MNESVRKTILTGYLKEKEKIEKEIKRFKELEETEIVKEYLSVQKSLMDRTWPFDTINYDELYGFTLDNTSILIQEHSNHLMNCEHNTLLLLGNYSINKKHNINKNMYVKSKKSMPYNARKYFCLDCGLTKLIFYNEIEDFEKYKIIVTEFNENDYDLNELRNQYFNLLIDYPSDLAVKKLKK